MLPTNKQKPTHGPMVNAWPVPLSGTIHVKINKRNTFNLILPDITPMEPGTWNQIKIRSQKIRVGKQVNGLYRNAKTQLRLAVWDFSELYQWYWKCFLISGNAFECEPWWQVPPITNHKGITASLWPKTTGHQLGWKSTAVFLRCCHN